MSAALRVTVMFTGSPVLADRIPLTCHPPIRFPAAPFAFQWVRPGPIGSWYTEFITTLCRTSKFALLRSHSRHDAFSTCAVSPVPTEPSAIACDQMYCVCHSHPLVNDRCSDARNPWKLLLLSLYLIWNWPNCGRARLPVIGSLRLT